MKKYIDAIHKAAHDTAGYMTSEVRQSALQHGWNNEVANSITVDYKDGDFHHSVAPEHEEAAWVHEYGTENERPTAVLRKYGGNADHLDSAFMMSLSKHLGGNV